MADFPQKVGLWGWLEARADRREARKLLLIDKGLDWRSLVCSGFRHFDSRLLIAAAIIGLFSWAFARETQEDTRNLMVGALIAAFAGAWGYYLGSSASAHNANERADSAQRTAEKAVERLPATGPRPDPEIELGPGERRTIAGAEED